MSLPTHQMMRTKTKMTSQKRVRVKESSDTVALVLCLRYRRLLTWPRFPGFHKEKHIVCGTHFGEVFSFIDNKCATTHIIHPMALKWTCPSAITTYICYAWKNPSSSRVLHYGTLLNLIPSIIFPKRFEWGHPSHPRLGRKLYMMRASNTCWKKTILEETNQSEWNLFPY